MISRTVSFIWRRATALPRTFVCPCAAAMALAAAPDASAQMRPYPYPYRAYAYSAAARIQVTPRQTEVYVDGYFAGIADDFDGPFQRLRLEPGEHEIELYLDRHRTFRQKALFRPGATLKMQHKMEPVASGEATEPRPKPVEGARPATTPPPGARPMPPSAGRRGERGERGERGDAATLSIRVQPRDAAILIDNEPWTAPEGEDRLIVHVTEGPHRVEVRKEGYRPFTTTLTVRRGETVPLNVGLIAQ